jgi:dGTPase
MGLPATNEADAARRRPEQPDPLRAPFHVDRDRIIHTKAFRRLKHKTQVFIAPQQDHFVTRLTHTIEVVEVARTIARALSLNEDLAEAAALGHDIGHGPFGHASEEALGELLPDGFRHNYQSVRVLDVLENGGAGLNLTRQVLDAIEKSSKPRGDIQGEGWGIPATPEGQVVKLADAIAYVNHDIGDAIRAGVIAEGNLPAASHSALGRSQAERVSTLIGDVVATARATGAVGFSDGVAAAANELREFMFERVYLAGATRVDAERGKSIARFLFRHFEAHAGEIASDWCLADDPPWRRAADYVSGMTDRYAIRLARELGCTEAAGW